MHLQNAYQLLAAADRQPNGHLKVQSGRDEEEVRSMAAVGLVEATFSNNSAKGSATVIKRVTAAGKTFLRTFAGQARVRPRRLRQSNPPREPFEFLSATVRSQSSVKRTFYSTRPRDGTIAESAPKRR